MLVAKLRNIIYRKVIKVLTGRYHPCYSENYFSNLIIVNNFGKHVSLIVFKLKMDFYCNLVIVFILRARGKVELNLSPAFTDPAVGYLFVNVWS